MEHAQQRPPRWWNPVEGWVILVRAVRGAFSEDGRIAARIYIRGMLGPRPVRVLVITALLLTLLSVARGYFATTILRFGTPPVAGMPPSKFYLVVHQMLIWWLFTPGVLLAVLLAATLRRFLATNGYHTMFRPLPITRREHLYGIVVAVIGLASAGTIVEWMARVAYETLTIAPVTWLNIPETVRRFLRALFGSLANGEIPMRYVVRTGLFMMISCVMNATLAFLMTGAVLAARDTGRAVWGAVASWAIFVATNFLCGVLPYYPLRFVSYPSEALVAVLYYAIQAFPALYLGVAVAWFSRRFLSGPLPTEE
jgi:hypothetical protein